MSSESSKAKLHLLVNEEMIPLFFQFLQGGIGVRVQTGCSIKTLLCEQLGLSPEYVEKRIQTVFLDGKPVDDMDSAIIRNDSSLTLSALMPGLAGRVLRRGSLYAAMRSNISHTEQMKLADSREGMIWLKLLNIVLKEIGPIVLEYGALIDGKDLDDFFQKQANEFWAGCRGCSVNGEEAVLDRLRTIEWAEGPVLLHVSSA